MSKPFTFVFRITSACDKHCEACCNGEQTISRINCQDFIKKLIDIKKFTEKEDITPTIGFTGGEPFFYNDSSNCANIYTLTKEAREIFPHGTVTIRTSGWLQNDKLDNLLHSLFDLANKKQLNISFGISLFQNRGINTKARLKHMLGLLLEHQDIIILDVIYNKINIKETAHILENSLISFNFRYRGIMDNLLADPSNPFRFVSRKDKKSIVMNTYPAYNACDQASDNDFFADKVSCGACEEIKSGSTQIYYMPDLSFYHCNDPFVDYAISPISNNKFPSASAEHVYLKKRLEKINKVFADKKLMFTNKQKRCAFCTKFMMNCKDV